jgi:hypothetical protein
VIALVKESESLYPMFLYASISRFFSLTIAITAVIMSRDNYKSVKRLGSKAAVGELDGKD